jgi:hypothetical protein
MPFSLPFLALGPRVRVEPQRIVMTTGRIMKALTLFSWVDDIEIDCRSQSVTIRRRRFWVRRPVRVVRYGEIQHIAYALLDHGNLIGDERGYVEQYDVALTLRTGEEVPLVRFSGDGEFVAHVSLPHEWIGDRIREALDVRGDQYEKSLDLVDLLSKRIGAPLGSSRYF